MSDGERFEMPIVFRDDPPEEPEVDESPRTSVGVVIACIVLVSALTPRLMPYSSSHTTDEDVVITDRWESLSHFAYGYDATLREEKRPDGTIMTGPIKGGQRHGTWTHKQGREKWTFENFRDGKQYP